MSTRATGAFEITAKPDLPIVPFASREGAPFCACCKLLEDVAHGLRASPERCGMRRPAWRASPRPSRRA